MTNNNNNDDDKDFFDHRETKLELGRCMRCFLITPNNVCIWAMLW